MSKAEDRRLDALQAALAAEHAAVYGYGVVGGRVGEKRRTEARAAYDAHRARRDALARDVRDLGGEPVAAAAGYALPFSVPDSAAAVRLAADLEDRVAGVYSDLVRAAEGDARATAAGALREAAVRAARWRGGSVAFPGLAERAGTPSGQGRPDPDASDTATGPAAPSATASPTA
ncbi:ferritin-like domain-containing protein [Streptomyces sp. ICN988]|uniref:ferritin-like domain-containing protein n=1 Tax=unclassified Streptomyces TaxID=2593676 RepID=UPI0021E3EED9|nr:ferritin-like domain-containing protein [Streptomyces sp. ICN988]MCV2465149.1 ferritin-like domain-containing protein [Streptomyces sp. ICN988]WSU00923.1 ferritin-like domain-containing protein [Streptomyces sp. NBC_01124]